MGWFHKSLEDYIVSGQEIGMVGTGPDNGFDGFYEGYRFFTSVNAGSANVRGWGALFFLVAVVNMGGYGFLYWYFRWHDAAKFFGPEAPAEGAAVEAAEPDQGKSRP